MARLMSKLAHILLAALLLCAGPAIAQDDALAEDLASEDDRGFIVGLLEDALGGEGRTVRVEGFRGALSSTAGIDAITVADADGVWLALENVEMVWNRSALLRGRIEIERLSAATVSLTRPPVVPAGETPDVQAGGFALPNLPVSVSVAEFNLETITLGEAILGEPAEMTLEASAQLAAGSGDVALTARRTDGQQGRFIIDASYDAVTQLAAIALDLTEAENGITARLLNLPGRPDLRLQVSGEGSIDDLVTDISLETDGAPRLEGQVVLQGNSEAGRDFRTELSGDLTPLLPAEYRAFFGDNTALRARGSQSLEGALNLDELTLKTGAVDLQGAVALDPTYWPTFIALTGQIAPETGKDVVLPFNDGKTRIDSAGLKISYDAAESEDIEAVFDIANLVTTGAAVDAVELTARGALSNSFAGQSKFQSDVKFSATGAQFDDPAVQDAVGADLVGSVQVEYQTAGSLRLSDIEFEGTDYDLTGSAFVAGLEDAFETEFDATLRADHLSRFAPLAGTDLRGQAELTIAGTADLGGAFDLKIAGKIVELSIGIDQADKALSGITELTLEAVRDESGTHIPMLEVTNPQLSGTASASLQADAAVVNYDLTLADSARIDPRLKGAVTLTGKATQDDLGWSVDTSLNGPFDATATLKGRATGEQPSLVFDLALPNVQPIVPQFSGPATVKGTASRNGDVWSVDTDLTGPYGVSGDLSGTVTGTAPALQYALNIPNVAAIGAQINGPLALRGTAAQQGSAWRIDTSLSGLSGANAQLNGLIRENGTLDLATTGTAPMALANPFLAPRNIQGQASFDLALNGDPALSSLSGTITTANAQLSAPTLRISLNDINARIGLNRGRAQVDLAAGLSSGGRINVQGPVVLTGGLAADLTISLDALRLVDPSLYDTTVDGQLSVRGPLSGGAVIAGEINVGETNIQVPASQASGFAIIPQITHVNASPATRQTLRRAGLDAASQAASSDAGGGASYGLDIRINAPSRLFVRGRGLDAELGGSLSLRGSTDRVISAGRFNLIRGRLDILGKRFALDEGSVALQGSLDPYLRFVATTNTTVGTASIIIEGPASQPEVTFASSPAAPQDEVLAQIFFGRDASTLSAFQALQLASAVTTLAGKGGESVVSQLRRGFGLDDFDVTTDTEGNTGLRLGKYISDNVYTDVTIGSANTAGVSINIDLTKSITARGQVKSNGDSSVGVYFEKDY